MLGWTHATHHMNLPNISSNDFSQSNTNATPIHHSQMPPQLSVVTCLNGAVSTPLWVRWPIFWGGWEKMICFETGKGRMFFLLEGAIVFFWSPGNSDQENLFYPNWFRLKWWIVCLPSFVTKVFGCTNWRSTPGRFDPTELPTPMTSEGNRRAFRPDELIFFFKWKIDGLIFLIFRNNITNSKDRELILVRLGGSCFIPSKDNNFWWGRWSWNSTSMINILTSFLCVSKRKEECHKFLYVSWEMCLTKVFPWCFLPFLAMFRKFPFKEILFHWFENMVTLVHNKVLIHTCQITIK